MKTTIFPYPKTAFCSLIGFFSFLVTSCGSYQNSSYYDSDGIYGNTDIRNTEKTAQNNSSNHYKEYFNSLQNDNQPTEIFTDVNNYSDYNPSNDTLQSLNQDYAGWGNNSRKTTINVYTNPNPWTTQLGFGWGYPYYGLGYDFGWSQPYYPWGYYANGWNNPYYNYGWNNPYSYGYYSNPYSIYGNSYYGYYNNPQHYSRSIGRRGSSSNSSYSNNSIHSRYSQNNATPNRRSNIGTYSTNSNPSVSPRRTKSQNQNFGTRTYSTGTRSSGTENTNSTRNTNTRIENNPSGETETRSESTTPSRSYSSGSNNTRNSDSNDGGGRRSGGNGRR